jgi:hypothetical protein
MTVCDSIGLVVVVVVWRKMRWELRNERFLTGSQDALYKSPARDHKW